MKRLRGCLMVAFIFGCGFLVGGFLGAGLGWIGFFHKVVKGGPGTVRELVMERVAGDLKLNPGQKVRVRKIVEETGQDLALATAEIRPKVEEIMGRGEDRIREVLNPDQQRKFDRFVNEGRRRWAALPAARTTPPPAASPPERPAATPASPAKAPAPETPL